MLPPADVLRRLESYYDAVPRPDADPEDIGPFTLFVSRGAWPFYARPRPGYDGPPAAAADVAVVRARQHALGVPETFEWVHDLAPDLLDTIRSSGLHVHQHPLQVLTDPLSAPAPAGVRVRVLDAADPALGPALAVQSVGFAAEGTQVGSAGRDERDARAAESPDRAGTFARRISTGQSVVVVAEDADGPLCVGMHQPVGDVTEIVGVATLPAARRRGLGAAVTAALVEDARRHGVRTVFLSAGSDEVARVYAKVGFSRVGTACVAEA